ncbi:MAG: hypothetical protein E3K32_01295 [wastewater metagenome]|nr:hypothetical protein [Candidatus Loosdrechtia aerotolerans]
MLILIDGYNFIFTVPELERHVGTNRIESVRGHIVSLFSRYREKKHYDITIVFDGCTEVISPKKQTYAGISVIYSKSGISADTEIKNITDLCQNPKDVCIVTYDKDIKRHVKKCGCNIIEPRAMYKEILKVLTKSKKNTSDEPEYKQKGPSENDAKYWVGVFRETLKDASNEEPMPDIKNIKTSGVQRKNKKLHHNITEEPFYKYQGPSQDEVQYWLHLFEGDEEDEY